MCFACPLRVTNDSFARVVNSSREMLPAIKSKYGSQYFSYPLSFDIGSIFTAKPVNVAIALQ